MEVEMVKVKVGILAGNLGLVEFITVMGELLLFMNYSVRMKH